MKENNFDTVKNAGNKYSIENLQNKKYFKNMDEAIKVYEEFRRFKDNGFIESIDPDFFKNLTDMFLSDYKRVLKENNRLEEQVEYDKTHIYTPQTIELNFISKSKIEDKIKKLNDVSNAEELEDIMNRKNYTIVELVQYVLQELLEGRK
jgi:hypothetical protein